MHHIIHTVKTGGTNNGYHFQKIQHSGLLRCRNGCCQLVSLKVKRVFTKLGLKCNVEANTVSVGKAIGQKYDVVYCSVSLEPQFADAKRKGAHVIPLKNIMSEAEIEEKTRAYLDELSKA